MGGGGGVRSGEYWGRKGIRAAPRRPKGARRPWAALLVSLRGIIGVPGGSQSHGLPPPPPPQAAMSLQWTVVATFLYAEVFLVLLLCVPFVSPTR